MNYTNKANLPEPLVSALIYSDYDRVGDISVSGLILPPRIRLLEKRHDDEMTIDVSELIWKLQGSIGHKIPERANTMNHLAEERLTMPVHGWVVSGKADLLSPDMTLDDYKFTSVWAMMHAKPEYEAQLNLYALLYRQYGFLVGRLRIIAPLRDWSKLRAAREPNYPQVGVVVREVPLWTVETQQMFMTVRVVEHQKAEDLADDDLPMCTPEERWHKPDIYAVKKKGNKRALPGGLHEDEFGAVLFAQKYGRDKVEIDLRPGEDTRCLHYCAVKEFCSYGKTLSRSDGQSAMSDDEAAA